MPSLDALRVSENDVAVHHGLTEPDCLVNLLSRPSLAEKSPCVERIHFTLPFSDSASRSRP